MKRQLLHRVSYVTAHLMVIVVTGVLLGAFAVQFVKGEFPCPLCILQRMTMMLAVIGPAWMIAIGHRRREIQPDVFTTAFGMTVIASVLGLVISGRQVLLHIAPGDPGYGSPVWGLHLYTWAVLVFVALLLAAGLHLVFVREAVPLVPRHSPILSRIVVWVFGLTIFANAVAVFAEAGFHLFLPDNPSRYLLFGAQLG